MEIAYCQSLSLVRPTRSARRLNVDGALGTDAELQWMVPRICLYPCQPRPEQRDVGVYAALCRLQQDVWLLRRLFSQADRPLATDAACCLQLTIVSRDWARQLAYKGESTDFLVSGPML